MLVPVAFKIKGCGRKMLPFLCRWSIGGSTKINIALYKFAKWLPSIKQDIVFTKDFHLTLLQ